MLTDQSASLQTSELECFPVVQLGSLDQGKESHSVANYSRGTKSKDKLCSLLGMSSLFMAQFNSLPRTGSVLIGCLVNKQLFI